MAEQTAASDAAVAAYKAYIECAQQEARRFAGVAEPAETAAQAALIGCNRLFGTYERLLSKVGTSRLETEIEAQKSKEKVRDLVVRLIIQAREQQPRGRAAANQAAIATSIRDLDRRRDVGDNGYRQWTIVLESGP